MKHWQALFVVPGFVSLLVACGGSGTVTLPPPPPPPPVANGSPVSGTISNWIPGKTGSLYAVVLNFSAVTPTKSASVPVSANGAFSNLVLPTPTTADLTPAVASNCSGAVTVTPSDAKAAVALLSTNPDSAALNGGGVYESSISGSNGLFNPQPGSSNLLRYYLDKDATISGSCTTTTATPKYIYSYNLTLVKGWNLVNTVVGPRAAASSDPISQTLTSGDAPGSVKFFQTLPETGNITQARGDYAKKLFVGWDGVPDATGYSLELKASGLDLGNGPGNYGNPIPVTGMSTVVAANPKTSYVARVKTKFGSVLSEGAESFFLSTSDLNPDGLNILFPEQGIPYPVAVAAGGSQTVALDLERGANCTQALTLNLSGASVGAASSGTISGTFAPNATSGNASSLTLTVGSSVPSGVYSLDLDASGCPTGVGTGLTLTVP